MIIIFILYQITQIISLPIFIIYMVVRKMKGKPVFGNLNERLGFIPKVSPSKKVIWFHAVSVGEILSIQNLIKQARSALPDSVIYVTCGTPTGKTIAQKNLDADYISFLPFDFFLSILLAFRRINPINLIIVEAEIWPNLLFTAHLKKIPTYLINARITKKSKKKYYRFKQLVRPLFNTFQQIYTQSQDDFSRFLRVGVPKTKLTLLGDIKTFNVLEKQKDSPRHFISKPQNFTPIIFLAGSIHPKEDKIYLNLLKKLKPKFSQLKLILAPRHFHWKEQLIENVKSIHLSFQILDKNSSINDIDLSFDIVLIFKLGILFDLYSFSDIFFLGGTFVPVGGHNLLEPAAWSNPSVIGPYHQNCLTIANQLLKHNALIKVDNEQRLCEEIENLVSNPNKIKVMGSNARDWLEKEGEKVKKGIQSLIEKITK